METIKGFSDYTGEIALKRAKIKNIIEETFQLYGFEPAETPVVEDRTFVQGDNTGDEAVSDMFKLEDKGKRKLALRYEFTFQLKRIAKNQKLPYKRYQIGEVFRDEPVSSSRFRQFTQCDVDVIGSKTKDEAEVLATLNTISKKLGIDVIVYVNNRKLLNEILDSLKIKQKEDVIRIIDKLDKKSESEIKQELKKYNAEKVVGILKKPKSFFKKYKSYSEIVNLKKACSNYGLKIVFKPTLARGLSYYNGTVFEARTKDQKQSFAGGGAFLINGLQAFGYGVGLERITQLSKISVDKKTLLIISINQDKEAIKLAENLRSKKISCIVSSDKISKALDYANSKSIKKVVFVGKEEVKSKKFKLKDMDSGKEKRFTNLDPKSLGLL